MKRIIASQGKVPGPDPKGLGKEFGFLLHDLQIMPFDWHRDIEKARHLNRKAIEASPVIHAFTDGLSGGWNKHLVQLINEAKERRGDFLVIYIGDRLVAMGGFMQKEDDENVAVLRGNRVDPDFGSKGLGRILVLERETRARERGYKEIEAEVPDGNAPMIAICKKLGYREIRKEKGEFSDFIIFRKELEAKDL